MLTDAMLSGIIWDGIKNGGKLASGYLKSKLKEWILSDSEIKTIEDIVNQAPDYATKSQKFMEAFLYDNKVIMKILENAKSSNSFMQSNNTFDNSPNQQGNGNTQNIHYHTASADEKKN